MFEQLGLIGCGLMGGSFALALKQAGLVKRVLGYSKSPSSSERARQLGVIDEAAPSALLAVAGADIVLIAVPVAASEASFESIRQMVTPQTLIMDVGSTKNDVVQAAQRALQDLASTFVAAHPIAGKELAGVDNADADLYRGCQVILTPTGVTAADQLQRATALWRALGSRIVHMTPQAHDSTFAAVSHLPHLLSFALMNAICNQSDGQNLLALAGPGFRDVTRIAASDPAVWRDILQSNRTEVLTQCQLLRDQLQRFEGAMQNADPALLQALITQASSARAQWCMTEIA